jgi:hypothetical protein
MEYHWWDLSESDLDALLYNIRAPFTLTEHMYKDWADFESQDPDQAYAWEVDVRFETLQELIISLRVIVQLLGVKEFPVNSEVRGINRYEWLSSIIDLALFRLAAIRDCCYFLVNDIFELDIPPLSMSFRSLARHRDLIGPETLNILSELASVGTSFRDERNKRAHEGVQRTLGDDTFLFKVAAQAEEHHSRMIDYDLSLKYEQEAQRLYQEYVQEVEALLEKILFLQEQLAEPFYSRYTMKKESKGEK